MTKRKIWLVVAMATLLVLFLIGCSSTAPVFYSNNSNRDFTVLGEVTYESKTKAGFQELLKEARRQYPDADYVVDVMVDTKTTTLFFILTFRTHKMRGTAIQYKN